VGVLVAHSTSFSMTANFINMFLFATVILALFLPETEGEDLH
jgi:putative MFS transporter